MGSGINVPVNVGVNVNVSGEEKLKGLSRTLDNIANGTKLQDYWKDQTTLINQLSQAMQGLANNPGSRKFAGELIKNFNAVSATMELTGKNVEDLENLFKSNNIDTSFLKDMVNDARNIIPDIGRSFSISNFKEAFESFAILKKDGVDLENLFSKLSANTNITQLQDALILVNQELDETKAKLEASESEMKDYLSGVGLDKLTEQLQAAQDEIRELQNEMEDVRSIAVDEFKTFLRANNLDDFELGTFEHIFDSIKEGSITAQDAITKVKTQFSYLFENGASIDSTALQTFVNKLEESCGTIERMRDEISGLSEKIETIGSQGTLSGLTQSLSESEQLTENQRQAMTELASDAENLRSVGQIIATLINASGEANVAVDTLYESISKFVGSIDSLAGKDISSLQNISSIFNSVSRMNGFDAKKTSLESLKKFIEDLNAIESTGSLRLLSGLNFDWANNLKISKSSIEHLTGFLNSVSGKDFSNLQQLSGLNFDAFNNLKISKANVENLNKILQNQKEAMNAESVNADQLNIKNVKIDTSSEITQMDQLVAAVKRVEDAIDLKNKAFMVEEGIVSQVVGNELTELGTLWATIDDISTAINNIKLGGLAKNIDALSQIDFSKFKDLANVDLKGFSEIKINSKSFKNLIEGIKDLSTIDLSKLEALKGIDFSGLGNLKYAGKGDNSLIKQSRNFIDTQNKQIDKALKKYRDAGVDEADLQELKKVREYLNANFTPVAMSDLDDINAEMTSFVNWMSEACNKCDTLAASMKEVAQATQSATSDFSKYNTLLNKEEKLLNAQLKKPLSEKEKIDLKEVQEERKAIEEKYKDKSDYKDEYAKMAERREAVYADYEKAYKNRVEKLFNDTKSKISGHTSDDFINGSEFESLKAKLGEIQKIKDSLTEKGIISETDIKSLNEIEASVSDIVGKLKPKSTKKGTYLTQFLDVRDNAEAMDRLKSFLTEDAARKNAKIEFGATGKNNTELAYTIRTKDGMLQKYTATFNENTKEVFTNMKAESEYITQGQQFVNSLKGKLFELTRYFTVMDAFSKVFGFIQKGIGSVTEINKAMTELKKVTDETSESYQNFQKRAGEIASEVGGSPTEIINATADFARVGNTLDRSTELARSAEILKNVSEFENIADATDSLISMTQAYKETSSEEIVDIMNNIGNNFAVSTDELSRGLQKSASTLTTGGNDIYEATALLTAGNTILQNIDSVAAGMKVISMRISGTTAKELNEIGEDADGLVETTSKLNENVKSLTAVNGKAGVSLLDENGNYRSTYEILQDIADVYQEILDADKKDGQNRSNALLEMLAGKNRSNVLASILQSPDILRNAYESAQNSNGSAQKELDTYLSSVQGKLDLLNTAFQNLWGNAVDPGILTFFIDLGTNILKTVDSLGMFKVAIGAISGIFSLNGVGRANAFSTVVSHY